MKDIRFKGYTIDSFYIVALIGCVFLAFVVQDKALDILVAACIIACIAAIDAYNTKRSDEDDEYDDNI